MCSYVAPAFLRMYIHRVSSRHWPSPLTHQDAARITQGLLLTSSPMWQRAKRSPAGVRHRDSDFGAGASLSAAAAKGGTPAHFAAFGGNVSCLHALHELGVAASLSATDAKGVTPAHTAAMHGHVSCLHALHGLGAAASLSAADAEGKTQAHTAAMNGDVSCLHALHELGAAASLSASDADGSTPLHDAACQPPDHADSERNYVRCVRFLLQVGADIDQTDGFGNTPLILAARRGHLLNVQELCLHGATRELAGAPTAIQVSGYPIVCRWLRRTRDHTSPLH